MDNLQTPSSKTNAYGYQIGELQSKVRQLTAEIDLIQQYIRALRRPPRWFQAPLAIGGSSPEDAPFVVTETGITSLAQDGQQLKAPVSVNVGNTVGTTSILSESDTGHIHTIGILTTAATVFNTGDNNVKLSISIDGATAYEISVYPNASNTFTAATKFLGDFGSTGDGSNSGDALVFRWLLPYQQSVAISAIVSGSGNYTTLAFTVYVWRSLAVD